MTKHKIEFVMSIGNTDLSALRVNGKIIDTFNKHDIESWLPFLMTAAEVRENFAIVAGLPALP